MLSFPEHGAHGLYLATLSENGERNAKWRELASSLATCKIKIHERNVRSRSLQRVKIETVQHPACRAQMANHIAGLAQLSYRRPLGTLDHGAPIINLGDEDFVSIGHKTLPVSIVGRNLTQK
jgi:hypothetical protein